MNNKNKLADLNYELIKQHILDPANSPLDPAQQFQLDRLVSVAKVLDKHPLKKHAVALHRAKYPEISLSTAYKDINDAAKTYNTYHNFDWDFWQNWILQNITDAIRKCREAGTFEHLKLIPKLQANLIKAIGEKPSGLEDPTLNESRQFLILIQIGKDNYPIDLDNLDKLPTKSINELNRFLFSGKDIDEDEAREIMNS